MLQRMNSEGEIEGSIHVLRNTLHEMQHMILGQDCALCYRRKTSSSSCSGQGLFLPDLIASGQSVLECLSKSHQTAEEFLSVPGKTCTSHLVSCLYLGPIADNPEEGKSTNPEVKGRIVGRLMVQVLPAPCRPVPEALKRGFI